MPTQDKIQLIDWSQCVALASGDEEFAQLLLDKFLEDFPSFHSNISLSLQKKNFSQLTFHVHKLHGGCCYCSLPKMCKITSELENLLRANIYTRTELLVAELLSAMDAVMALYRNGSYRIGSATKGE